MLGFRRIHKPQPVHRKPVWEIGVSNILGRFMWGRGWGAVTIPFLWFVVILYWLETKESEPPPLTRVHEFVHISQDELNSFFLVSWFNYLRELGQYGYRHNIYEVEAYRVQALAEETGLPDWAAG